MKALVKSEARPDIWMKDIAEPKVGPNDVLIKIVDTDLAQPSHDLPAGLITEPVPILRVVLAEVADRDDGSDRIAALGCHGRIKA